MEDILPGAIILEKYRVERKIGEGGMGVVVSATHLQLDEKVAIKFLLPEGLRDPIVVARFLREARAAVKIRSEHVCKVGDVGTLPSGEPYIVMEYLEGNDLAHELLERGPLPVEIVAEYAMQACEALAQAHALGIVHRDLKPANLFLARRPNGQPCVKVLDFGISKFSVPLEGAVPGKALTETATVMGSPLYMSPEQMRSTRGVGPRSDIWSMGVVLYELLTGKTPFDAETPHAICAEVLTSQPEKIGIHRQELPAGLQALVMQCLEKNPDNRPASVVELAIALGPFASEEGRHVLARFARGAGGAGPQAAGPPPDIVATLRSPGAGERLGVAKTEKIAVATTDWDAVSEASPPRQRPGRRELVALIGLAGLCVVAIAISLTRTSQTPRGLAIAPPAALLVPVLAAGADSAQAPVTRVETASAAVPAPTPPPLLAPASTPSAPGTQGATVRGPAAATAPRSTHATASAAPVSPPVPVRSVAVPAGKPVAADVGY